MQEENDDNYEEEPEVADEYDSDFDDDVSYFQVPVYDYVLELLFNCRLIIRINTWCNAHISLL